MSKNRKSLKKPRAYAFQKQSGMCFYCRQPMWVRKRNKFASRLNISDDEIMKFQCTGEHLVPHCKGGSSNRTNIVAACRNCNELRAQYNHINPELFSEYVQKSIVSGKWNVRLIAH